MGQFLNCTGFLFLTFVALFSIEAEAAYKTPECIVNQGGAAVTNATDFFQFRKCLQDTEYEAYYDKQCQALIKKGGYSRDKANCIYHSELNFYCDLKHGGDSAEKKACIDQDSYYGFCTYQNIKDKHMLAPTNLSGFLFCIRGTPYHVGTDAACKKAVAGGQYKDLSSCLKRNFVNKYCQLLTATKPQADECALKLEPFIQGKNLGASDAETLKNLGYEKSPTGGIRIPLGKPGWYIERMDPTVPLAKAPKKNPAYAGGLPEYKRKRPPKPRKPVNPRATYSYYKNQASLEQAANREKRLQTYRQQASNTSGLDKLAKQIKDFFSPEEEKPRRRVR